MVLITVLYSLIGLKLRETSISEEQNQKYFERKVRQTHKIRRKHSQSTRRVVKMLVAVVVAFFICWAPFHAQRLVAIYGTNENHLAKSPILLSVYYFLTYTSGVFYYISTCINPIFYHIMSNKFREAFKKTTLWCCRSREQAVGKRCSYTAMAFPRNPTTSSVNSGNSLKNSMRRHSNLCQKFKKQASGEGTIPTIYDCRSGKTSLGTPVRAYRNYSTDKQHVLKNEFKNTRNNYLETQLCVAHEISNPVCTVCCTYPLATETITVSPDAITPEESKDFISDEPEKYLKEIKLRTIQRDEEYG
ncbi:unnamed protein product [Arctia plantaginis]|uniref:G-protein coupled receptors family 1 profile domain-containing protein n=2 Tax=Arctia plantaginis TaxID=874455 RepID=A0A8S0YVA9_ARCPL|nr:unnamed protein product [Arctia plantaginis]